MARTGISWRGLVLTAALVGLLTPALAAETKKATWTAYVTWRYPQTIEGVTDKAILGEASGFDIRDSGDPEFPDTMTFRCVGLFRAAGDDWKGNGTCMKTDKAGDILVYSFTPDKFFLEGGTGKFKGMRGEGTEHVLWEHDLRGATGPG
jgi:hypothetical protein